MIMSLLSCLIWTDNAAFGPRTTWVSAGICASRAGNERTPTKMQMTKMQMQCLNKRRWRVRNPYGDRGVTITINGRTSCTEHTSGVFPANSPLRMMLHTKEPSSLRASELLVRSIKGQRPSSAHKAHAIITPLGIAVTCCDRDGEEYRGFRAQCSII